MEGTYHIMAEGALWVMTFRILGWGGCFGRCAVALTVVSGSSLEEGRGGLAGTGGRRQGDSNAETVCGGVGAPQNLGKGSGGVGAPQNLRKGKRTLP